MTFFDLFQSDPDVSSTASGRINLIGEHTDYNGGFVLPAPIPRYTNVELRIRPDRVVRVATSLPSEQSEIHEFILKSEKPQGSWLDYVQGVTNHLLQSRCLIEGFDAFIQSSVPVGSGLSSSASLEIALLRALNIAFHLNMNPVEIAQAGQSAENNFVGTRVGIMDQIAISAGKPDYAMLLDCSSLTYSFLSLPRQLEWVIVHSGITHTNREGKYNQRREECEQAAQLLGVNQLREITRIDQNVLEPLPSKLRKRVRHVVSENSRVLAFVEALEKEEFRTLGALFNESHDSLRDEYEVSIPEMDELINIARTFPETIGARMTGGGFGGCAIVAAPQGTGWKLGNRIVDRYNRGEQKARLLMVLYGKKL